MRNRKPVKVAGYAQAHNLFMTLLSLWMAVETVVQARKPSQTTQHQTVNTGCKSTTPPFLHIYQGCLTASVKRKQKIVRLPDRLPRLRDRTIALWTI